MHWFCTLGNHLRKCPGEYRKNLCSNFYQTKPSNLYLCRHMLPEQTLPLRHLDSLGKGWVDRQIVLHRIRHRKSPRYQDKAWGEVS